MPLNKTHLGTFAVLTLAALCAGCALAPEQTAEGKAEKQYRTGSNLPRTERQASEVKTVDPNTIQPATSNRRGGSPGLSGG
jgi:hypothetical protein